MADDFKTARKQVMDESDIRDWANDCEMDRLSDLLIALNAIFDTRKRYYTKPKKKTRSDAGKPRTKLTEQPKLPGAE